MILTSLAIATSFSRRFEPGIVVRLGPHGEVATLPDALKKVREKRKDSNTLAEIQVEPGSYYVERTISLGPEDGNLKIVGEGDKLPTFVGGIRLSGWRLVQDPVTLQKMSPEARKNVLACHLTGSNSIADMGMLRPRGFLRGSAESPLELFAGDVPLQLARWPAADQGFLRISSLSGVNAFTFDKPIPPRFASATNLWAFGYWKYDWADSYERVTSLDVENKKVELGEAKPAFGIDAGRRFFFFNAVEAIDRPGDWYLDRDKKVVYFWPPSPKSLEQTMASTLSGPMIRMSGAKRVTIANLDLEVGRGSCIEVNGADQDWITGCEIRNFGQAGVSLVGKDSGVTGCDLKGLGQLGIHLVGGDRKTLQAAHLVASDNEVSNFAKWTRTYQPGIQVEGVGNTASHNSIHDAPHQAILLSGNDNNIEYNDISRVCTETGDSGAIYMGRNPVTRGNKIRFNRFSQFAERAGTQGNVTNVIGVYLDDGWSGTEVSGNIFDIRTMGVMIGGGRDNAIENNVFLDCHPAVSFDARGKGWAAKQILAKDQWDFAGKIAEMNVTQPPYSVRYPALANILNEDPAYPKGNSISENFFVRCGIQLHDGLTNADFRSVGNQSTNDNISIEKILEKPRKGFSQIPISSIGPKTSDRPSSKITN